MKAAAIIPACNEAPTVAKVIRAAQAAPSISEVIVADGESVDGTPDIARAEGARVVSVAGGKGEGMAAGVAATDADVIVFLDADLTGLRPDHVERLVRSVTEDGAGMALGLFDRGRWLNPIFLHLLPRLTGERALRRELFTSLSPKDYRGYRVEAALNSRAAELGERVEAYVLDGMFHRTKEEKHGNPVLGFAKKVAMLSVAVWEYLAYQLRRRVRLSGRGG